MATREEGPVAKLVNAILLVALKKGASQIVVRESRSLFVVEHEIDGRMQEEMRPPRSLAPAIFERIAEIQSCPGGIHLATGDQHRYFAVEVTSSRDGAHASIRPITALKYEQLGRAFTN